MVHVTPVHPEGPQALPGTFSSIFVGHQSNVKNSNYTCRRSVHLRLRKRQRLPTRR